MLFRSEYYKLVYPSTPGADSLFVDSEEKIEELPLLDLNIAPPPSPNKPEETVRSFSVPPNFYTAETRAFKGGPLASFVLPNYAPYASERV